MQAARIAREGIGGQRTTFLGSLCKSMSLREAWHLPLPPAKVFAIPDRSPLTFCRQHISFLLGPVGRPRAGCFAPALEVKRERFACHHGRTVGNGESL